MPAVTTEHRALIADLLASDTRRTPAYGIGVLLRDLADIQRAVADRTPSPGDDTDLTAALRHAADRIATHYGAQVLPYITEHHQIPARFPVGDADDGTPAGNLATITWDWPGPDDRDYATLLEGLFYPHEHATALRHGYDPAGRQVIHCPASAAFAVAWPVHGPPQPPNPSQSCATRSPAPPTATSLSPPVSSDPDATPSTAPPA